VDEPLEFGIQPQSWRETIRSKGWTNVSGTRPDVMEPHISNNVVQHEVRRLRTANNRAEFQRLVDVRALIRRSQRTRLLRAVIRLRWARWFSAPMARLQRLLNNDIVEWAGCARTGRSRAMHSRLVHGPSMFKVRRQTVAEDCEIIELGLQARQISRFAAVTSRRGYDDRKIRFVDTPTCVSLTSGDICNFRHLHQNVKGSMRKNRHADFT
jgi:hypothetical protein